MRGLSKLGVVSLWFCCACLGDLGEPDVSENAENASVEDPFGARDPRGPDVRYRPTAYRPAAIDVRNEEGVGPEGEAGDLPLIVPPGFAVNIFARDTGDSRSLVTHAGRVYAARALEGDIVRFEDDDADGVAERAVRVAECFEGVHGLAFHDGQAFFATPSSLYRAAVDDSGDFAEPVALFKDLVSGGPRPKHGLTSDGTALYLSTASSCESCVESHPERATITRIAFDGSSRAIYARGLRNPLAVAASSDGLWSLDAQRRADVLTLEVNSIAERKDYGWPYCGADARADLTMGEPVGETAEAFCARSTPAALVAEVQAEPHALVFAARGGLPAPFADGAFATLRGLRQDDTPSRVLFIAADGAAPTAISEFATARRDLQSGAYASLSGLAIADDGALLVADDVNGLIYRIHAL